MKTEDLARYMLPEGMLEFFEITQVEEINEQLNIHLSEKNIVPQAYKDHKLQSKGFYEPVTVQDFPLRNKACYLKIKRRRWLDLDTGHIVYRNWNMVVQGTRLTAEFAAFLKAINRYNPY